ncbi:MAG TPA: CAP domain-containing protein [Acidimicrobiales bacterium]|nr:CAP domain-containing protein [Acidimicrobiales bacterium]
MRTPRPRTRALAGVAIVLTLALAACMSAEQTRAVDALNRDRRAHGLRSLPTHDALNQKAQAWADKIARDNRLSHSNLAQGLPGCYRSAGENVGYDSSVEAVEAGYMASPGHRANILDRKWTHVGVGAARNGSRWFTVQVFLQAC